MIENLFQDLYGVDAPAHGKLTALPDAPCHNWFKGGFAAGGNGDGLWDKVAKEEGRGETERGREGGGNGEGE